MLLAAHVSPMFADVWEYDAEGNVITAPQSHGSVALDARLSPGLPAFHVSARNNPFETGPGSRQEFQALAEEVAFHHAGGEGVRAAGLSADEFAALFVALIQQESGFDPLAVSHKGAQGLGQLMPETAALLGVVDALDPLANLDGAARYLDAQLARFGRVELALAAYNAGPHRVEEYGGVPPFHETRAYVSSILASLEGAAEPWAASTAVSPPATAVASPVRQSGSVIEWTD